MKSKLEDKDNVINNLNKDREYLLEKIKSMENEFSDEIDTI